MFCNNVRESRCFSVLTLGHRQISQTDLLAVDRFSLVKLYDNVYCTRGHNFRLIKHIITGLQNHDRFWCVMPSVQFVFTALHAKQTQSSDENSVCPSVKRVDCGKTEKSVHIFIPYKDHLALFSNKKNGWCGATPST